MAEKQKVKAIIKKLDGKRLDLLSDEWGTYVTVSGGGPDEVVGMSLSPSDVQYLYDYLSESLGLWDQSEI